MNRTCRPLRVVMLGVMAWWAVTGTPVEATTRLKNICRLKGQEENTLQGLGLVIGLRGTGDGGQYLPMIRSLATAMQLMGNPVGTPLELKDAKNVALVMVTARVPAAGARQGDTLDCQVSSIGGAKSLAGGRLVLTPLQGPNLESSRVFAFCEGALTLDDPANPTVARVHGGCRLEEDFFNAFTLDGKLTLVLDPYHADFETAQDVAEAINSSLFQSQLGSRSGSRPLARAISAVNIEVELPVDYRDDPVLFVSQLMGLTITDPQGEARVVINERAGSVVIGADVEILPVVVTHKNLVVEAGVLPTDPFIAVDSTGSQNPKLKTLVEALAAVKVPTDDVIEIIRGLDKNGKLLGRLVIE